MDGFEAGTSGALAAQHLADVRGESTLRRGRPVSRVRRGVGVGLVRLGQRLAA